MRPHGPLRQALIESATALATRDQWPTLREMAAHAQVGLQAATYTVDNLARTGVLRVARARKVDYRSRPVAEYRLASCVTGGAASAALSPAEVMRSFWETP